jgi:ATP-dependent RNA helicase RhlE
MPFKSLGLHPLLVRATTELGYKEPTPVQLGAIPPAIAGRDVIATAQTGTGKTAAFLLPLLHRLLDLPRGVTRAIILSPTRELAEQISEVCRGVARHTRVQSTLVVGGQPMGPQEKALRAGVDVVIATPGRLLDHLKRGTARFDRVTVLVLDEADSMLDMGFLPDVRHIAARLPARKHTLLFSATMPPVIAQLSRELLRDPAVVQIGRRSVAAVGITQAAYPVPTHLKTAFLRHLLRETEMPSVLVFTRTKHSARKLARVVSTDGFKVAELHSNRTPAQRKRAMDGFRRGEFHVMVATNIAARGLDVDHITHVVSMDVPDVPEDYVHRIGRTGRAGAEGDAFILVSREEEGALARIERQVGQRLPRVTLPDFDYTRAATPQSVGPGDGRPGRDVAKRPHQSHRSPDRARAKGPAKFPRGGHSGDKGKARRWQH